MSGPEQHFRTCHICEAMCGVVIEHQDGQVLSIKGDKEDPLSRGHVCPKVMGLKEGGVDWALDANNRKLISADMEKKISAAKTDIINGKIKVVDYRTANSCPVQ